MNLSKYCPKCKHNFSDEFDECVYCGSELMDGIIEIEDTQIEKPICRMSDSEILEKYADYRKRIAEQTGHEMSDRDFIIGIREARRDSLNIKSIRYINEAKVENANVPKCPTCQSNNIKKVSNLSKVTSVVLWGLFSQKVKKQWHCNNCGSEW